MPRSEFKKALQSAFYAGQGMSAAEAVKKIEGTK